MPAFLIVHSQSGTQGFGAYRQPPTLDIGGLRAPLDWGEVTLQVPPGDIPVTVFVTRADGNVEGSTITVRVPRGTGTRLAFRPGQAGGHARLAIEGQWPADSSMHYYAARDGRTLTPHVAAAPQRPARPMQQPGASQPARTVHESQAAQQQRAASPVAPGPSSPPVGPAPGSTGSVPERPSTFGQERGATIGAVHAAASVPAPGSQQPSFGQRTERDVYGREHAANDRQAAPIPTPAEFSRLEREAHEAQQRAYAEWQAQQGGAPAGPAPGHEGRPEPIRGAAPSHPTQAAQGWYQDPFRRADLRWFDGQQWTPSVLRGGQRANDPLG